MERTPVATSSISCAFSDAVATASQIATVPIQRIMRMINLKANVLGPFFLEIDYLAHNALSPTSLSSVAKTH